MNTPIPRTITDTHIHEGGTHITNFPEDERHIYVSAVKEFDEKYLIVSEKPSSHMKGAGGALHWIGEHPAPCLSYFWRLWDIAKLRTELAAAQERIRAMEVNDARWRKARTIFSIEDIERAEYEMRGGHPQEEENLKADAAIDASIAKEAERG